VPQTIASHGSITALLRKDWCNTYRCRMLLAEIKPGMQTNFSRGHGIDGIGVKNKLCVGKLS